jgi:hypothetical protein
MALGTQKVSAMAAPGMAAAATAHPLSGGRGIAAANQSPVESTSFSTQVGVNDNGIVRYDDELDLNADGKSRNSYQRSTQTPLMSRRALAFNAGSLNASQGDAAPAIGFKDQLTRGIGGYLRTQSLTQTDYPPPGSSINQLS